MPKVNEPLRYHVSPYTGEPGVCEARVRCPFSDLETEHYPSREEAQAAWNASMAKHSLSRRKSSVPRVTALPPTARVSPSSVVVPPGVYILGDPSYVLGNNPQVQELWEGRAQVKRLDQSALGALVGGRYVVALRTLTGPGTFMDNSGREFGSDSGLVGFTSLSLAKRLGLTQEAIAKAGCLVSLEAPTEVTYDAGILTFGSNIQVFTEEDLEGNADLFDLSPLENEESYETLGSESDVLALEPLDDLEAFFLSSPAAEERSWEDTI